MINHSVFCTMLVITLGKSLTKPKRTARRNSRSIAQGGRGDVTQTETHLKETPRRKSGSKQGGERK